MCALACHRNGITHIVEEDGFETLYAEGHIENTIVNGCAYTVGAYELGFRQCTTMVTTSATTFGSYINIRCGVGQTTHTEGEAPHLLRTTTVGGGDGDSHFTARSSGPGNIATRTDGLQGAACHRCLYLGDRN